MEFSELFDKRGLELARGWDFCNFLIKAGGVVEIPKQGVKHRSENFKMKISIKIKKSNLKKTTYLNPYKSCQCRLTFI